MIRDFIFSFFVFLIVRYMLARTMAGDSTDMRKALVYSFFYAVTFVIVRHGWSASYKAHSERPDKDKASR